MSIKNMALEFLEFMAGVIAGSAVHVVVSNRAQSNVTVALKSRSIVLHSQAGLFDLCVAARILRLKSDTRFRNVNPDVRGTRQR